MHIYAFDKIDGSNIRAEWSKKLSKKTHFTNGFTKFGTRGEMIKYTNNPFYEAVEIFKEKFSLDLDRIFNDEKTFRGVEKITVFGEFFGNGSFAGRHDWKEHHDVKIFDIFVYKKDYLPPSEFIKIFGDLDICQPYYNGEFTNEFIDKIENNLSLKEGVVCKGTQDKRVFMFKIKTHKWLQKTKELYGESDY